MALKMETPFGTLTVSKSKNKSYQELWIELHRPNEYMPMTVALIGVDNTDKKPQLITHVWGDGLNDDCTVQVVHENVNEFFEEWSENK